MSAFSIGFRAGRAAHPLFGVVWEDHWLKPLGELRESFLIDTTEAAGFGEGIMAEAA